MPITSPPRKVSETENMLRLLLSVDALDSVTSAQLWTFAAEQELMDYVSMRLCLYKLLAAGELETGEGALTDQLLLTDRGREALSLFGRRLPADVRERICAAAPAYRLRVERARQVQAVYEMARPNDFRLNLSVCEGDLPTMRLRMETANRTLAGNAIHRFAAHAAEATTYLYTLAEQALSASQGADVPTEAGVTEHSNHEYTARVVLPCKRAQFTAELLLPTRKAAGALVAALAAPEAARSAAEALLGIITRAVPKARS